MTELVGAEDMDNGLYDSPVFDVEVYEEATDVDRHGGNELIFHFEDLSITLRKVVSNWDVCLRIEAGGEVLYSKVRPSEKVKEFWREVAEVAFDVRAESRGKAVEEVYNKVREIGGDTE